MSAVFSTGTLGSGLMRLQVMCMGACRQNIGGRTQHMALIVTASILFIAIWRIWLLKLPVYRILFILQPLGLLQKVLSTVC